MSSSDYDGPISGHQEPLESPVIHGNQEPLPHSDNFWIQLGQEWVKAAFEKQIDAAKQIINVSGLLQGIYFIIISQNMERITAMAQNVRYDPFFIVLVVLLASPPLFWLASMYYSIRVVVPKVDLINIEDEKEIQTKYNKTIQYNTKNLSYSHNTLLVGLLMTLFDIIFSYTAIVAKSIPYPSIPHKFLQCQL